MSLISPFDFMRFAEWPFLSSFDEDLSNAQQVARREDQQAQARRERTPGSSVAAGATPRWHGLPRMDIIDSKDKQLAIVEMPGLTKDKVSIELRDDGALHIAGAVEHENESKDPDAKYRFSERSYGSFARTIPVPRGVTKDEIKASLENGLLKVTIPKKVKKAAAEQITIA